MIPSEKAATEEAQDTQTLPRAQVLLDLRVLTQEDMVQKECIKILRVEAELVPDTTQGKESVQEKEIAPEITTISIGPTTPTESLISTERENPTEIENTENTSLKETEDQKGEAEPQVLLPPGLQVSQIVQLLPTDAEETETSTAQGSEIEAQALPLTTDKS